MSVFIGYPSFMAYQMMKGKKDNNDGFPSIPGMIARYSALGLTNEQMAANPVWADKTGNGYDLQLKNFSWKGMSGVGGYGDENHQTFYKFTLDDYVFIATPPGVKHMNFTFRVTGLQPGNKLTLAFFGTTNTVYGTWNKDGIYTVDADIVEAGKPTYFYNGYSATRGEFTIEILPLYPGFILGDGVDDFAVTEKELNFEDTYTVYTPVILLKYGGAISGKSSTKDFSLISGAQSKGVGFDSANQWSGSIPVDLFEFALVVCKRDPETMHVKDLITGKAKQSNSKEFVPNPGKYFIWRNTGGQWSQVAIAGQIICNGHFSTDEEDEKVLDWYKKQYPWLFPDQAWTVVGKTNGDEDRATIANITGNGNDLILSNFGFAEGSGYGLYNIQKFTNWNHVADRGDIVKNGYSVTITNSKITSSSTNYNTDILYSYNSSSTTIIFKVTGLVDGQKIFLGRKSVTDAYVIDKDGIYRSDYNIPQEGGKVIVGIGTVGFTGECDITIEQIPEYEGYLVTDGVDDKIASSAFEMGKDFTVVGEWVLLQNINTSSLRKDGSFVIRNHEEGLSMTINRTSPYIRVHDKSLKAFCSNGAIYKSDWTEQIDTTPQSSTGGSSQLMIAGRERTMEYDKIAFKNLAIYPTVLSKDDCIKAYNYLQTLKAK